MPSLLAENDEKTFYQTDSEKAFTESMHKIVLRALDIIIKQYGDRQQQLKTENDTTENL